MFYHVKMPEAQRDLLRFLSWPKEDRTQMPKSYRMGVHLFGAVWVSKGTFHSEEWSNLNSTIDCRKTPNEAFSPINDGGEAMAPPPPPPHTTPICSLHFRMLWLFGDGFRLVSRWLVRLMIHNIYKRWWGTFNFLSLFLHPIELRH